MIKQKVWTPNGYQVGPTNSMVGKGESIIDYTNGTGTLVTKGKVGVDNQPSSVRQDDRNVIAGNDIDWTNGVKFSQQIAPLTAKLQMYNDIEKKANKKPGMSSLSKQTMQLQAAQLERAKAPILQAMKNITDRQEKQHQIEDYAAQFKANCGKDRFANGKSMWEGVKDSFNNWTKAGKGKVSNAMLDTGYMIPAVIEKQMLNHWMKENPLMPNIYAANRYGQSALQTLNRLRVNPYNQLQALNQNDRTAYYRMQQDGGYTGGQRQAGRVALALGNARNVADVLNNTDLQNNKYRQDWATAALAEGNQDAARRQAANQYAWEAYNRAHGAKTKGIETHLSNLGLIGQKWLSQRIKNKQYGDVLDMYQQDLDNKNAALKAIYGIGANDTKSVVTGGSVNNNTTPGTSSGNLNILNQYHHNTPLGNVFSLFNPYRIPQTDISMQRIPKGKYWMTPDQMPLKRYNSDQIRQAISNAQNTRQWAQNVLNQNEINMGTIGDGNIYRDAYIRLNIPNNYTWQSGNRYPLAKVTYIPGIDN